MSTPEPKPQPRIKIDGVEVAIEPGDTIMKAAERLGVAEAIPRFCYHPSLPVAGTCRMCTVEVEKAPKLMTSCSTPAADGMVVHTQSDRVRKSRAGVMEFLLINHPLDCPVCDQAGECSLQDYNYEYGPGSSRYVEDKRVWKEATTKKLSDEITLNMNRCVHCERCVRFTESVTKTNDLLMLNRGWKKELATPGDKGMSGEYQGCVTDICPVGALTFNDFRFKKRVWFLKSASSICDRCSKGCNISVQHEKNVVHRYLPEANPKVNGHWMCDEGRKSYHTFMDPSRVASPLLRSRSGSQELQATSWETLRDVVGQQLREAKSVLVVLGTDCTSEEAQSFLQLLPKTLPKTQIEFRFFNGTPQVNQSQDDAALDHLLRRKDKTPNTRGLEALGVKPLNLQEKKTWDLALHVRFGRAGVAPSLAKAEIAWGVWHASDFDQQPSRFLAFVPGLASIEKAGSFTNCDGITQTFQPAVKHLGDGRNTASALQEFSA